MGYIMAGDFRKGVTFKYESKVVTVVEFLHVKPGKGAAFVRTKLRDVINGGVVELTFNPTAKFETAEIVYKKMQYSYTDGDLYYFMDPVTFDMIPVNYEMCISHRRLDMGFVHGKNCGKNLFFYVFHRSSAFLDVAFHAAKH